MFELTDAVAVVTGAGRGIGRAVALALTGQGARVIALDRDAAALAELDRDLDDLARATAPATSGGTGLGHTSIAVDVTDHAALRPAVAKGLAGAALPILVNNAALLNTARLTELDLTSWHRVFAVNLDAALVAIQAAAEVMEPVGQGRIVNIASIAGKQGGGLVGTSAYASAKGGLIALTKSAARELAPAGITVNAVAPGPVATGLLGDLNEDGMRRLRSLIPVGRLGDPREVAAAVCFLASREAAFITGEVLDVNGGLLMD